MANLFDNLYSLADAARMWHIDDSALRRAISSGKLIDGVDAKKFGKQWVVTSSAMEREYGRLGKASDPKKDYSDDKLFQVYYYESEILSSYCKRYDISTRIASLKFSSLNIWDYIYDCYDYIHLGDTNDVIKDVARRIRKGIKYEK